MKLRKSNYINKQKLIHLRNQCKIFADEDNNLQAIYENLKHSEPNYLINLVTDAEIRELQNEGILE